MPNAAKDVNQRIVMIRRTLEEVPSFTLPLDYAFRCYQPGDEAHWLNIHVAAEHHEPVNRELYARRFGTDPAVLARRQLFLLSPTARPIGTATAWHDPYFQGQNFGRVHYVAVVPDFQGRGLSKPLMTAVLLRLKELGYERAYLATSAARLPAIGLYLKFGFEPLIRGSDEEALWSTVMRGLGRQREVRPRSLSENP
jgi:GNAT superfamily N-acetyltransferase